MNIKIAIGLIGAVAAGVCAYVIAKYVRGKNGSAVSKETGCKKDVAVKKDIAVVAPCSDSSDEDIGQAKQDAVSSISARHRVAKDMITESVANIFNETEHSEDRNTQNSDSLKKTFEDLESLERQCDNMEEQTIQAHDFVQAKNELKRFADNTPATLKLDKFQTSGGLFNLGDHKVTGEELNNFVTDVQNLFIRLNDRDRDFIKEFGQVYMAFESLDKDYIQGILIAVKSAEKASMEAKDAQHDIKETIEALQRTIIVLAEFKAEVTAHKHLKEIDVMWEDITKSSKNMTVLSERVEETSAEFSKRITPVEQFKNQLEKHKHILDVDVIWDDVKATDKSLEMLSDRLKEMNSKLSKDVALLSKFQDEVNKIQHLSNIDTIWEDVQSLKDDMSVLDEKLGKNELAIASISKDIITFYGLKETLDRCSHLLDVDELWVYSHECGGELVNATNSISNLEKKYEKEVNNLSHRLKIACGIAGGALLIAAIQLILNLVGLI